VNAQTGGIYNSSAEFLGGAACFGTSTPDPSAQVHIGSTTKGLLIPSMNTTNKNAIAGPAINLEVFDSSLNQHQSYQSVRVKDIQLNGSTQTAANPVVIWAPFQIGQYSEYAFNSATGTSGYTASATLTLTASSPSAPYSYWWVVNTSNTGSTTFIDYTIPVNPIPVGVYRMDYILRGNTDAPVCTMSYYPGSQTSSAAPAGLTTIRSVDCYTTSAVPLNFVDYFVLKNSSQIILRFASLSKNASSSNWFIGISMIRLTLLG
jgi:hypothetical protein